MPRLHSEVSDRHLPRIGTDFRLLRKSASRSTDGHRLPIRQPGGERAEAAVSRLEHSAVDNRSPHHQGRRRYPSVSTERPHKPARGRSRLMIPATKHRDRLSRAARRIQGFRPNQAGTARDTFVRHAQDSRTPTAYGGSMTQSPRRIIAGQAGETDAQRPFLARKHPENQKKLANSMTFSHVTRAPMA